MKKLIATILFFASFGVAMGAHLGANKDHSSNSGLQRWFEILGIKNKNTTVFTAPLKIAYDKIRQKNNWTSADIAVIDKCNRDNPNPAEIAYCAGLANCSTGWENNRRCMGSSKNPNNPCRPATCTISTFPAAPRPQPQPAPNNCDGIQKDIDNLEADIEKIRLSDFNNEGLLKELRARLLALRKKLEDCQNPPSKCKKYGETNCKSDADCKKDTKAPFCIKQTDGTQNYTQCVSDPKQCLIQNRCLSFSSKISTPTGEVVVTDLKVGDIVWTTDTAGNRIARPIVKTLRMPAVNHRVVHLVLADGRTLDVSAPHQTADGRTIGELKAGDAYDGSIVQSAALIPYAGTATYDILPAGDTGFYFANSILMGSTLK